jgi:hypothetical protein
MDKYDIRRRPVAFQDALQSLYRHFLLATLDFVELQKLPYDEVLRCQCALRHQHLIADGILVCVKAGEIHMCGPWLPEQPADGGAPVPAEFGSEYGARFAIRDRELRSLLRPLTTSAAGGWQPEELIELRERCVAIALGNVPDADLPLRPVASALLAIFGPQGVAPEEVVTSDGSLLHPHLRSFLRELSAHSPACQIVHACELRPLLRCISAAYSALAAEDAEAAHAAVEVCNGPDMAALRLCAPCIQPCIAKILGWAAQQQHHALCIAFLSLAEALVEVCHATSFCKLYHACAAVHAPEQSTCMIYPCQSTHWLLGCNNDLLAQTCTLSGSLQGCQTPHNVSMRSHYDRAETWQDIQHACGTGRHMA